MKHGYLVVGLATLLSVGPAAGQRQSSISIELEDFVNSAKVSGGQTSRQDMRGFGGGWSGSAQLFWGAPPPVDKPIRNWPHLAVWFEPPSTNTYEVILHYTSAPDFGTFRVFLDGQPQADVDVYSSAVTPQNRSLGQHKLNPGKHELLVTVFSKAGASRGFSVGLDRIELRPAVGTTTFPGDSPQTRAPGGGTQSVAPPVGLRQPPNSISPPSAALRRNGPRRAAPTGPSIGQT